MVVFGDNHLQEGYDRAMMLQTPGTVHQLAPKLVGVCQVARTPCPLPVSRPLTGEGFAGLFVAGGASEGQKGMIDSRWVSCPSL